MRIYLDHNATSLLGQSAKGALLDALEQGVGNPSSLHQEGRKARSALEKARRQIAVLVGVSPDNVVLTSGGTESVELGLRQLALKVIEDGLPRKICIGATEHPCVFDAAANLKQLDFELEVLPVDSNGLLDGASLSLASQESGIVAFSLANHETGVLQNGPDLLKIMANKKALLFADAVQLLGKGAIPLDAMQVDAAAFSGHKIGAPTGIGALWLKDSTARGANTKNSQERGRRPGTEALLAAIGFGAQAEHYTHKSKEGFGWKTKRDKLEQRLMELGFSAPHGQGADRVENTVNIRFPGIRSEVWIPALDLKGFSLSAGAACTSGDLKASTVLLAMGVDDEDALEAIRISMGPTTSEADLDSLITCIEDLLPRLIEFGS